MAKLDFDKVKAEYEQLFTTMVIKQSRMAAADAIVTKIADHKSVYETVMLATGVPWQIAGIIHSMEAGLNFGGHLHNGDPLTARTVQVPKGRPKTGEPPFTFAESAIDALQYDGLAGLDSWQLAETLYRFEKYNGIGYRKRGINTPYLWSFSNHYSKGKFVKDGKFDPNAVSRQCGAAVLLKRMIDREIFAFTGMPHPLDVIFNGTLEPTVAAFVHKGNSWIAPRLLVPFVPGLSVTAISYNPLRITLHYQKTSNANAARTRTFSGEMFQGNGHVDASDFVIDFLGLKLSFNGAASPARLEITKVS